MLVPTHLLGRVVSPPCCVLICMLISLTSQMMGRDKLLITTENQSVGLRKKLDLWHSQVTVTNLHIQHLSGSAFWYFLRCFLFHIRRSMCLWCMAVAGRKGCSFPPHNPALGSVCCCRRTGENRHSGAHVPWERLVPERLS